MKQITKATRTWVAPGVVALALLAACGDEVATQAEARSPSSPTFHQLAEAERLERIAKLDDQRRLYLEIDQTPEFVPGSRHMPVR